MSRLIPSLAGAAVFLLAACGKPPLAPHASANHPLVVYVTNYPLFYFAQRLAADRVSVVFPMKESGDPAEWLPGAAIIADYQRADLILVHAAGYSGWLDKAALPRSRTIDTGARLRLKLIPSGGSKVHRHGPKGEHSHAPTAFTTWLDPQLAMLQAETVAEQLARLAPAEKVAIEQRLTLLKSDWSEWMHAFEALVAPHRDIPAIASHPVYQYLEKAGGLNWRSVHWEPGEPPSPEQWNELAALLKQHPARWMVWEDEPLPAVRAQLAQQFGIRSVVFDPCAATPKQGDLLTTMQRNLEQLRKIYGAQAEDGK